MNANVMPKRDLCFALTYSSNAKRDVYRKPASSGLPTAELRYSVQDAGRYSSKGQASPQARFKGKTVFVPSLVLKGNFSVKAVIDRMIFTVVTTKVTSAQKIQSVLHKNANAACYVKDLNSLHGKLEWRGVLEKPSEAATVEEPGRVFAVLLQEPTAAISLNVAQIIQAEWGVEGEIRPFLVELALDFYVSRHHDPRTKVLLREQMVGYLQRHHYGLVGNVQNAKGDGRQVYERESTNGGQEKVTSYLFSGRKNTNRLGADADTNCQQSQERLKRPLDNMLYLDATLYFGTEQENLLFRIQHKISDKRNKTKGTFQDLPEDKKRARIEVELSGFEMLGQSLGLHSLADFGHMDFRSIRRELLTFWLPTADADFGERLKVQTQLEARGIYGVEIQKMHERCLMNGAHNPKPRHGQGKTRDRLIWKEVTERVGNALDALSKQWHEAASIQLKT
jgi:hypothetical protein